MTESHLYELTIDLHALNHLGINLYSNIPAVVSEVVANSYDADAEEVRIDIDTAADTIIITDNGCGMTRQEINERYLKVGYDKRKNEPKRTPKHSREPMGRKGIGKLSLFSIADTIEVHSVKDGEKSGFVMNAAKIKKAIKGNGEKYYPDPVNASDIAIETGTRITVRDLKKGMESTALYLRKRLARRFSVIGAEYKFEVVIDGTAISVEDRDYFNKIEYLWRVGEDSDKYSSYCKNSKKDVFVDGVIDSAKGYRITGWAGTFDERKSIEEGNNTIVILARGRLVHEDILKDLKEARIFRNYLIGEIRADFLDDDNKDDIATSDRQSLKENDPRFAVLKEYIRTKILNDMGNKWTAFRNENAVEKATQNPKINEWFGSLSPDHKKYATSLFGKIDSFPIADEDYKQELYKHGILAFQTLALKENLKALDAVENEDQMLLLKEIFADIDELEAAHYYQIVKGRLEVLKKFEDIAPSAKEKAVHEHIFNHLWLLDPSWERASTDAKTEQSVTKEFNKINAKLTPEEKDGRIDIRYRTAAGKHIIIELKKGDRKTSVYELAAQIGKYKKALQKCLSTVHPNQPQVIEVICLVGSVPEPQDDLELVEKTLAANNARFITYDNLIDQTRNSYREYLEAEKKITYIQDVIDSI